MANNETRNYRLSDAELCMFTSNLCNTLTRDLADLAVFGMTAPKIAALKALGDAFEVFTTDEVYSADVTGATEDKNVILENIKEQIRNMVLRCQMKWGSGSRQEKSLGVSGMNRFSDDLMLVAARRVFEQMTTYLADLASLGLTQDILDDFEDLNTAFEEALNNQNDKIKIRVLKTEERITKGNELYLVVSDYCDIGKRVYVNSSPARYNDYVIYSASAGSLHAPENLSFYFPTKLISWDMVEHASSYVLLYSETGGEDDFTEIYAGSATEFIFIPPVQGWNFFRCKARSNSGFGPASDILQVGYYDILPPPSENIHLEILPGTSDSIRLSWNAVPSATKYKVYRSTANIGDVAGSFLFAGLVYENEFIEVMPLNHRYYYRITSENNYQASGNSLPVWIEL